MLSTHVQDPEGIVPIVEFDEENVTSMHTTQRCGTDHNFEGCHDKFST